MCGDVNPGRPETGNRMAQDGCNTQPARVCFRVCCVYSGRAFTPVPLFGIRSLPSRMVVAPRGNSAVGCSGLLRPAQGAGTPPNGFCDRRQRCTGRRHTPVPLPQTILFETDFITDFVVILSPVLRSRSSRTRRGQYNQHGSRMEIS